NRMPGAGYPASGPHDLAPCALAGDLDRKSPRRGRDRELNPLAWAVRRLIGVAFNETPVGLIGCAAGCGRRIERRRKPRRGRTRDGFSAIQHGANSWRQPVRVWDPRESDPQLFIVPQSARDFASILTETDSANAGPISKSSWPLILSHVARGPAVSTAI